MGKSTTEAIVSADPSALSHCKLVSSLGTAALNQQQRGASVM